MLDVHATHGTPGAVTLALAAELATICAGDGAANAGVPIDEGARLMCWGGTSLLANTIGAMSLLSQDQVDAQNGEQMDLGALSLQNEFHKWTNLLFSSGKRTIKMSTNTAQADSNEAFTVDFYEDGNGISAPNGEARFWENQICIAQTLAADIANSWVASAVAPANPLPNGKYGILGIYAKLLTQAHVIRFAHANFNGKKPGFPLVGSFQSDILNHQQGTKDILQANPGYQFVAMAELTDKKTIPTFKVTSAGTGLNIESLSMAATDTPVVMLNLVKLS